MFESPWHWVVVIIVALVLFFGWKQLPDMARSVGRSLRVFKTEIKGMSEDDKARENARETSSDAAAQPKALDPTPAEAPKALPQAQIVKKAPADRPRPTPQGSGTRTGSSSTTGQ